MKERLHPQNMHCHPSRVSSRPKMPSCGQNMTPPFSATQAFLLQFLFSFSKKKTRDFHNSSLPDCFYLFFGDVYFGPSKWCSLHLWYCFSEIPRPSIWDGHKTRRYLMGFQLPTGVTSPRGISETIPIIQSLQGRQRRWKGGTLGVKCPSVGCALPWCSRFRFIGVMRNDFFLGEVARKYQLGWTWKFDWSPTCRCFSFENCM